jgi:hypothetical protein
VDEPTKVESIFPTNGSIASMKSHPRLMLAKIHKRVADGVNVRASSPRLSGALASPAVVTGRGPPPL